MMDSALLTTIVRLAVALLTALLGLVVLYRGRKLPWLFSGAAAFLLGILAVRVLVALFGSPAEDADRLTWTDLVPVAAGVLGALAGKYRLSVAYNLIGIATGGALALWIAQTLLPEGTGLDFWSAVLVAILMALGMLFVTRFVEVALIVLSAGVGAILIRHALALSADSALVAALGLAAAIGSLVIQYHDYLIELRAAHRMKTEMIEVPQVPETVAGQAQAGG